MPVSGPGELEQIELDLLLEGIHRRYGYDLSGYAAEAVQRPIRHMLHAEQVESVSALLERVLRSPECMRRLLQQICDTSPDGPFNEVHLITCRESWPRFGRELQQRVADVMHRSLAFLGFLALRPGESIDVSPHADRYELYRPEDRIYRRMR